MNDLSHEDLEGVRAWAQKRVDYVERRRRMRPILEAVAQKGQLLMSTTMVDVLAGPTADARRSLLKLEQSVAEWPTKQREQDERLEAQLAQVRRRAAALRAWLEALS